MQTITPFITFTDKAEEAVRHYLTIFEGKVVGTIPGPNDTVMGLTFEILGQTFFALNGGPSFTFSSAFSMFVTVDTQDEIDRIWARLLEGGGSPVQCGWLVDKFGLSWQIIPKVLPKLFSDPDRVKAGRAVQAMMGMQKLDIAGLQRAFDGA